MKLTKNSFFPKGLPSERLMGSPYPSVDASGVLGLLSKCPVTPRETQLIRQDQLAQGAQVADIHVKDERQRMNLGSFKALGAAYVIAKMAAGRKEEGAEWGEALSGETFVTASAGNHGLSVAAGARVFGAGSTVFLADSVPDIFERRLQEQGSQTERVQGDYEDSVREARRRASESGHILLSDTAWPGYFDIPFSVMEGYLALAHEVAERIPEIPTHIFLQAGVGGLAGSAAAYFRHRWGSGPAIIVVEPEKACALQASVEAGELTEMPEAGSRMGRLDCKAPSLIALAGLSRDANWFCSLGDEDVESKLPLLESAGLKTSSSGGAGLAAFLSLDDDSRSVLGISHDSRILAVVSECPEDG